MMDKIVKIHQKVLDLLVEERKKDPSFTFLVRNNNRDRRLEKGYWFLGNENYVAISFWSGTDWKNKTPNIFFRINKNGSTQFELVAKDSKKKFDFFQSVVYTEIEGLRLEGQLLIKRFSSFKKDYIASLKKFLVEDKQIVDRLIEQAPSSDSKISSVQELGRIPEAKFRLRFENIQNYQRRYKSQLEGLPITLKRILIENLPPIKSVELNGLDSSNQWIFLTGLNGTGKSSILRAIAAALCRNSDNGKKIIDDQDFYIEMDIEKLGEITSYTCQLSDDYKPEIISEGFASYGPSRQIIVRSEDDVDKRKHSITYSLFNPDGYLLNVGYQLYDWISGKTSIDWEDVDERIEQIIEILTDIIPSLLRIELPENNELYQETLFVEEDGDGNELPPVNFEDLASGTKSLVAMLGDMLLRLTALESEVKDFSKLRGIVIIDEIDIHFHPILQRLLVELLTSSFPYIQFITSTHSPIPLLGAPKNSTIFRVSRTFKNGTTIERLIDTEKELGKLLPNSLLSSPIFGFMDLFPKSKKDDFTIRTEDDYMEFKVNEYLSERLGKQEGSKLEKQLLESIRKK